MKKSTLLTTLMAAVVVLSSCGTQGNAVMKSLMEGSANPNTSQTNPPATGSPSGGLFSNLLSTVMNTVPLTQSDIVGRWSYTNIDAIFESENVLAKAGGAVMAAQVESKLEEQLAKVGFQKGTTSFTFNKDNTFTAVISGKQISGNYLFDAKQKTMNLTAMGGLFNMTPHVVRTSKGISLLFPADKLLSLAKTTATIAAKTGALGAWGNLTPLLDNYKGMRLGMELTR